MMAWAGLLLVAYLTNIEHDMGIMDFINDRYNNSAC